LQKKSEKESTMGKKERQGGEARGKGGFPKKTNGQRGLVNSNRLEGIGEGVSIAQNVKKRKKEM